MLPLSLRPSHSFRLLLAGASLCAVATAPGRAATQCFNVSCAVSCTPGSPVQISTLVPSSQFPPGAVTPIAFLDPADGRFRRLISTQEGAVLVWDGPSQTMLPTMFLDLRDDTGGPIEDGGERGLLAMALDPDYVSNGRFYVFYTRRDLGPGTQGDVVIERYERSAGNPDVANPASATTILVIEHSSAANHNGGQLAFGPNDGFLYISTGDGGEGCDSGAGTNGDGQRSDTLLGKILRIDVRGIDPGGTAPDDCGVGPTNYTVPSTNPFSGQEPACDEVWALGLRNPFRFTFDRATGDMYIGDVGQLKWEEIDLLTASTPAPVNFGWVCREGCETAGNDESECPTAGCPNDPGATCLFPRPLGSFQDPVLCHHNGDWNSILAGYRYRGSQVPSIAGDFLYNDVGCGQIWKTTTLDPADPANIQASCWASGFSGTFGFAEDAIGELYILLGFASRIDCIHNGAGCVWTAGPLPFFDDGFESGDTTAWSGQLP
ncbi:MAG: PQQ-dependent sugar dehydrogenase [Acidobacteria bacterium]|nr:PQQ-dependent sugar dehydrogenase [Acidobacteriota bacterium]